MNAVLDQKLPGVAYRTSYFLEDDPMENETQLAELRSDVKHYGTQIGDIKVTVHDVSQGQIILRDKIDATSSTINTRIESVRSELGGKVDGLSKDLHAESKLLTAKVEEFRRELSGKIDQVIADVAAGRREITGDITAVRTDMSGEIKAARAEMSSEIKAVRTDMSGEIKAARAEMSSEIKAARAEMSGEIKAARVEVIGEIVALAGRVEKDREKGDVIRQDLLTKIDAVKDSIGAAKLWALGLYITLAASLLVVMAHGFKWI